MNCKRSNGSDRAFFTTVEQAEAFKAMPENIAYHGDRVMWCRLCGYYHLSAPHWNKPFEIPASEVRAN